MQQLQNEGIYGIEKIYTKDELAERYGQNGPYSFMLEAEPAFSFGGSWMGDVICEKPADQATGTHGHMPEKGPQPVFMAHGPSFCQDAVLQKANMVDVAPTLAAVLGQEMPEADGRVLTELLVQRE